MIAGRDGILGIGQNRAASKPYELLQWLRDDDLGSRGRSFIRLLFRSIRCPALVLEMLS